MYLVDVIKRTVSVILFSFLLLSCSPAMTESVFKVGTDYQVIAETHSEQQKVVEHFSLYCSHCYASEEMFSEMKSAVDKSVSFERSHVVYFPQNNKEYGRNMTFAFATAIELGIEDEFVAKVFDYHFKDNMQLGDVNDLKSVFVALGQSGSVFEDTINSDKTLKRVKTMIAKAQRDKVRFTPDLIVNDKYRVMLTELHNQGDQTKRLTELVNFLLTNP